MKHRLLYDRRGISIAEVVVAMAMVLIITGAAISVQIASTKADVAFRHKYNALNACENAEACLRYADGDAGVLDDALEGAGFTETREGVEYTYTSGDYVVTVVKHEEGNYAVTYNGETIYEITSDPNE